VSDAGLEDAHATDGAEIRSSSVALAHVPPVVE
jgi:hypothetical protein